MHVAVAKGKRHIGVHFQHHRARAHTVTITSSITNEAAEELGLKAGMKAFAVIKASDVMVGV